MGQKIVFGGRKYEVGHVYAFDDLPRIAKTDAILSDPDQDPGGKWRFRLDLTSPDRAELWLQNMLSEKEYQAEFSSARTKRLMRLIPKEGLKSPPLGTEGVHRLMAMIRLNWQEIPVFTILERGEF